MPHRDDDYDDDYDDRPRRRSRRDDDDYDDRPRGRTRRDDDDYDDDNRPRRRSESKSSSKTIWIVLGVFVVLGLLGALLVFGVFFYGMGKVRTAAARAKDANNLKQIGMGMLNDSDMQSGRYYAPLAHDRDGDVVTAKLSHRVSLLPYIEQGSLFNRFDLTADWDSPRNQSSSNVAVMTYQSPAAENPSPTSTPYRVIVGGGALFDPSGRPVKLDAITDGGSNTIMCVSSTEVVPWAAPRELTYTPNGALPPIGSAAYPDGANVLLCDGSVRFLRKNAPEATVRALITKAGNEPVATDW